MSSAVSMYDLKSTVIWGASGHASVAIDAMKLQEKHTIFGLIDDVNIIRKGSTHHGITILGGREQISHLAEEGVDHAFIAIGNNHARMREAQYLRAAGFNLIKIIHPRSTVAESATIGSGSIICAGVVICPDVALSSETIVNTSASVDHDCLIEAGAHIGPGVRIGGGSIIKRKAWIGIGAVISDRITIGASSIIGAGSVVVRDIPDGVVAYGVPAKVIREINEDDL